VSALFRGHTNSVALLTHLPPSAAAAAALIIGYGGGGGCGAVVLVGALVEEAPTPSSLCSCIPTEPPVVSGVAGVGQFGGRASTWRHKMHLKKTMHETGDGI
jgi:hypothetical protein